MFSGFKWLVAMGVAASTQLAAANGLGTSPTSLGVWQAGMQEMSVPAPALGAPMQLLVWYPTDTPERATQNGAYRLSVASNAPFAQSAKARPLVAISHGTGAHSLSHHLQAAALARAGYVVAAPMHPGDNYRDRSLLGTPRFWIERPRHISAAIDALLAHADWASRIDATKIGAIGHSSGGFSVAALLGLPVDPGRVAAHCLALAADPRQDPSCALGNPQPVVSTVGVENRPDTGAQPTSVAGSLAAGDAALQNRLSTADPRIRAGLVWAPYGAVFKAPVQAWPSDAVPTLRVVGAELDELLPRRFHFDAVLASASRRPNTQSRMAIGAGHFSFIAPPLSQWVQAFGPAATDPPGFDRHRFQEALSAEAVAFFDQFLK